MHWPVKYYVDQLFSFYWLMVLQCRLFDGNRFTGKIPSTLGLVHTLEVLWVDFQSPAKKILNMFLYIGFFVFVIDTMAFFFFFWYLSFLSNNSPLFLDLRWDARIIWNAIVGSIETHWRASFHQASTTSLISLNCGYLRLFSIWCKEITNCIFSDKWLTYCNFFCLVLVCFLVGT